MADRRVPARQARQGRRVRAHEAEVARPAARSSTRPSAPARSSRACAPSRRTCSTSTTPATRSCSWTRGRSSSSRCRTRLIEDELPFMQPSSSVQVMFVGGNPSGVDLPASVVLEVTETEPGVKGDTVSNVTKPATLETGAVIQVPLFVNVGDKRIEGATPREKRYIEPRVAGRTRRTRRSAAPTAERRVRSRRCRASSTRRSASSARSRSPGLMPTAELLRARRGPRRSGLRLPRGLRRRRLRQRGPPRRREPVGAHPRAEGPDDDAARARAARPLPRRLAPGRRRLRAPLRRERGRRAASTSSASTTR